MSVSTLNKDTVLSWQRIYCNSYTQKISGNDQSFILDLGSQWEFQRLQLDYAAMENWWLNVYQSQKGLDFSDASVTIAGVYYPIRITQFCDQTSLAVYLNTFTAAANLTWVIDQPVAVVPCLRIVVNNNAAPPVAQQVILNGQFWIKQGFKINQPQATSITATNTYDFYQPPMILVQIDNLKSAISNGYGTASFVLQNNSSFGTPLLFQNTIKDTCNVIYFQQPVSVRYLTIKLLTCDQTPLNTIQANNTAINMVNPEFVFLFSCA